ncbi:uncharacterized protein si:ch73-344o19.1 isoform X3 [Pangasianodon hypophthalmus]|uniref:uncharacterized protein si:ch73-344o19.1 isoform X3 n=1 Tax=Pangasianodon hypophthalmus TaxID=310915 RepID=UPI0023072069|nr:uncharacterized protein si:ch73-344o19.1 isoform X3 [Pangasianodon hypophthalmus]
MDALVCVVWSVALLTHTPSLKGASTASLLTLTSILTTNHANTKITDTEEPNTETTIGTGIIQPAESIMSTNATEGSLDITPSLILLRSTTITPGSSIPSSTNLSEEQNSSQSTTSETIPTVSLIPPSIPASTLKDLITGSASLGKENQDWPSELDVGDEALLCSPSYSSSNFANKAAILNSTDCKTFPWTISWRIHRCQDIHIKEAPSLLMDTVGNNRWVTVRKCRRTILYYHNQNTS